MHIPDGYLSPATAVPFLAAMVPFWGVALHKVKAALSRRRVPLLALCAAFSFVIMMFNIPIVGGSSAHAVGAVFIAILIDPWAACISVSTALLIQALVFGDGGILAFGVNCFNMAVVMPFAGYAVYKLIAGRSAIDSKRRIAGAFVGSYAGINIAALCAAVEFGIQPLLFKAADGTPLYCPYNLSVSIPSMMFAHSLFAGPLEGVITAAAVGLVIKYTPDLFTGLSVSQQNAQKESFFKRYKGVVITFAALVVLTPLGLIAQGTAWGEGSGDDIRQSLGYIPQGFAKFADFWKALMPDYSLTAAGNSTPASIGGYILSAVVGILLISLVIFATSKMMLHFKKAEKN
jgi:cobalt/nickel transport system permease protein